MKIEKGRDGSATIIMSPGEVEQMKAAIERMSQSFVAIAPVFRRLAEGMRSFEREVKESGAAQNCQRLDPAFSGPADEHPWHGPTPESLRALRKGEPTEPGHALGSRVVAPPHQPGWKRSDGASGELANG